MKTIFILFFLLSCKGKQSKFIKDQGVDTIIVDAGGGIYKIDGDSIAWVSPTQIVDDSTGGVWLVHSLPQKHRVGLLNFKFPDPMEIVVIIDNDTMRLYQSDTIRIKTEFGNLMAEK